MKRTVKIVGMIFCICLVFSVYVFGDDIPEKAFTDVNENHQAWADILKMTEAGILDGYEDGTFRPDATITRAQFIKIVNKTLGYTEKVDAVSFVDVKADDWYYNDLLIAVKAGYISGYDDLSLIHI